MSENRTRLSMRNISIEFPGVKALSNVDYDLETGRVYALIGANGAGKSTLMKVLSGVNNHYEGQVLIDDKECEIRSPKAAKDLGIEIVYQEVDMALAPNLSVAENILMNTLVNKMGKKQFVNWKEIRVTAKEQLNKLGIDIDVRKRVYELSLAEKQMVLIARAMLEKCRFLLLDEPTAPLSNTETENLFKIVRHLAEQNVGIVFISHRLSELFEICEHITVMKDGKIVTGMPITEELTINQIVEYMLGRKMEDNYIKKDNSIGDEFFTLKDVCEKSGLVQNINMSVRKGEIVGVAGLVGAGKTELCKTIFGAYPRSSGEISLNGKKINPKNPTKAVACGLAFVPEERRKEGILVSEPVYSNITMVAIDKFLNKAKFVVKSKQRAAARKVIQDLGIKTPSENQLVGLLSGGNQQKVVVGKWLVAEADIYIFDEPTKGVDVGAKRDIYQLIEELAAQGKGVIYATCEFQEILSITDRAYVMFDGEIVKEVSTQSTSESELLYYSTGGH